MVFADIEGGCDLTLFGALADQRGLTTRAERKGKGIEQDRLAGPGLASEHGKAAAEIDVQPIDENDVADGQAGQHETGSRTPKNGKADHTRFLFCRLCREVRGLSSAQALERAAHPRCRAKHRLRSGAPALPRPLALSGIG